MAAVALSEGALFEIRSSRFFDSSTESTLGGGSASAGVIFLIEWLYAHGMDGWIY
jgi:hypothetical protein